ncbi:MAG TPA: iduronate sulfatase [Planctomycetaceae bacterium]|nr:iduronate sulfatase [Planctomycetaceae bacterium]
MISRGSHRQERFPIWLHWQVGIVSCLSLLNVCEGLAAEQAKQLQSSPRRNVLFVVIDDLRPALACFGDPVASTPNIDRLARRGMAFQRAYCQQAVCSPSRLSLLTGRRPDTIQVWDLKTHFRQALPELVTLPQHFKNAGYYTQSLGKIYHGSGKPSKDPPSWSADPRFDYVRDPKLRYATSENLQGTGLKRSASEAAEVADDAYIDGIVCAAAVERLAELKRMQRPFFLAVGFRKPHLPFCAPQKYWDLYKPEQIPFPVHGQHPVDAPELATRSWGELEGYTDIPQDGELSVDQIRRLRHGYYACVSYMDALVGRLLDALDQLQLAENTIVVLTGDHGFHLGEQGLWTKANNFELSTRVPLVIASPGQRRAGSSTTGLVELVDIYPTLADLCGLEPPVGVEGVSMKPLLDNPDMPWKRAAWSQYPRAREGNRHRSHGSVMGYALRTARYRYVEWIDWQTKQVVARELYDHQTDPGESRNVAADPDHVMTLRRLSAQRSQGWRNGLPDRTQQDAK